MKYQKGLHRGGPCNMYYYFDGKYWFIWGWADDWCITWAYKNIHKGWNRDELLREVSVLEFLVVHGKPLRPPQPTKEQIRWVKLCRKAIKPSET